MVSVLGIVTVILGMYSVFGYLDPWGYGTDFDKSESASPAHPPS